MKKKKIYNLTYLYVNMWRWILFDILRALNNLRPISHFIIPSPNLFVKDIVLNQDVSSDPNIKRISVTRTVSGIARSFRSYACHAFCTWICWVFQCNWSKINTHNNGSHPFSCFGCKFYFNESSCDLTSH